MHHLLLTPKIFVVLDLMVVIMSLEYGHLCKVYPLTIFLCATPLSAFFLDLFFPFLPQSLFPSYSTSFIYRDEQAL